MKLTFDKTDILSFIPQEKQAEYKELFNEIEHTLNTDKNDPNPFSELVISVGLTPNGKVNMVRFYTNETEATDRDVLFITFYVNSALGEIVDSKEIELHDRAWAILLRDLALVIISKINEEDF